MQPVAPSLLYSSKLLKMLEDVYTWGGGAVSVSI